MLRVDHTGVHVGEVDAERTPVLPGGCRAAEPPSVSSRGLTRAGDTPTTRQRRATRALRRHRPARRVASGRATGRDWHVAGADRDGARRRRRPGGGALDAQPTRGHLLRRAPTATAPSRSPSAARRVRRASVTVPPTAWCEVSGRVIGPGAATRAGVTRHKKTRSDVRRRCTPSVDGRFEAAARRCGSEVYRFGRGRCRSASTTSALVVTVGVGGTTRVHEVPLVVAPSSARGCPSADRHRRARGPRRARPGGRSTRITLQRPVGAARGRYTQNTFRRVAVRRRRRPGARGLLVRSYFGEHATDSGVSVQKELRARGATSRSTGPCRTTPSSVPDGGIPVVVNSDGVVPAAVRCPYYLDNMYQPDFHRKPAGQVSWRPSTATRSSRWAVPHWEQPAASPRRRSTVLRPARGRLGLPRLARDVRHPPAHARLRLRRARCWRSATRATTCCCRRKPTTSAPPCGSRSASRPEPDGGALRADVPRLHRRATTTRP